MLEDLAFREWCREMYDKYRDNPDIQGGFKKTGDLMKDEIIENLGLAWRLRNPKLRRE
jgi:hypothetical protein